MRGLPLKRLAASAIIAAAAVVVAAPLHAAEKNAYTAKVLVSDEPTPGATTDPNLVNAWGLASSASSPWWVADNETDKSTLYTGAGAIVPLVVSVPGAPTGLVFNGTSSFVVSAGGASGPARFIFATESGTIRGWNPGVPPQPPMTNSKETEVGVDSSAAGAIYKGLAIAQTATGPRLYAADFHNAKVDVYNGSFVLQSWTGAFVDPGIPDGFAPFGIQTLNGMIFVTYAKQDADAGDEIAGEGLGFVSAFGTDGSFLGRVASGDDLNAPWGLAWAPATGFGRFSGDLLVGNFGDGRINAYAWTSSGWEARGHLKTANHLPLAVDGLWGIGFGNGAGSGPTTTLYFAAGPDDEEHGLFGSITFNN
jgi:uncharacterized protein (TIGR03118 family)